MTRTSRTVNKKIFKLLATITQYFVLVTDLATKIRSITESSQMRQGHPISKRQKIY